MFKKIIVLVLFLNSVNCQNWALNKLIPVDYNKYEVPLQNNLDSAYLTLNASITLNSFAANEKSQSLTTDITLCLNWTDYRIQNLNITPDSIPGLNIGKPIHLTQVKLTKYENLWLPIVYFRNAMSASIVNTLNNIQYVQVWPEQKLLKFCTRMSVEFLCRFDVVNFPFDEQYCNFELESFEKAAQHLQIFMQPMVSVKGNSRFRIRNTYIGRCSLIESEQYQFQELTRKKTNITNSHNCAFAGVRLVRNLSYYIIRYYTPPFLFVCIGFASFWLPTNAWPARIMLTATVLLTVITSSQGAYNEVPSNDVVPLYWYLWGIQFFVYMTLIEFACALAWVQFVNDKKLSKETKKITSDGHYFGHKSWFSCCGQCIGGLIHFIYGPIDHFRDPQGRNKVDYFARIVYPFMLLVFVITYIVSTIPVWANKWRW